MRKVAIILFAVVLSMSWVIFVENQKYENDIGITPIYSETELHHGEELLVENENNEQALS